MSEHDIDSRISALLKEQLGSVALTDEERSAIVSRCLSGESNLIRVSFFKRHKKTISALTACAAVIAIVFVGVKTGGFGLGAKSAAPQAPMAVEAEGLTNATAAATGEAREADGGAPMDMPEAAFVEEEEIIEEVAEEPLAEDAAANDASIDQAPTPAPAVIASPVEEAPPEKVPAANDAPVIEEVDEAVDEVADDAIEAPDEGALSGGEDTGMLMAAGAGEAENDELIDEEIAVDDAIEITEETDEAVLYSSYPDFESADFASYQPRYVPAGCYLDSVTVTPETKTAMFKGKLNVHIGLTTTDLVSLHENAETISYNGYSGIMDVTATGAYIALRTPDGYVTVYVFGNEATDYRTIALKLIDSIPAL